MHINIEKSWIMYDIANSAYVLFACSILPIYFNELATNSGLSSAEYLAYWSLGASIVTAMMLLIGPLVGSLSDRKGWRKPIFMGSVVIGILASLALGIPKWWLVFLIIYIISRIAYNASIVVYDSMLNDVTTHDRMDGLSSRAFAAGYIGSCIPFIFCLVFVVFSDMMSESAPLTFSTAFVLGIIVTAVWWFLFSLPLFKNYNQMVELLEKLGIEQE
jgi:UMF1 family MFS transporter